MRWLAPVALAFALSAGPAPAQEGGDTATLADIRQQLAVVKVRLDRLRLELSTTGGATAGELAGASVLDRVEAFKSQVEALTARTEEIEFRIERVVEDGTRILGDLAFRLCELEEGCDPVAQDPVERLGGAEAPAPAPAGEADGGPRLAVNEQSDFARAKTALEEGRAAEAAELFTTFIETYPGGRLTARAELLRGRALAEVGRTRDAAGAYLDAYSAAPEGEDAPAALLALGGALDELGKRAEACKILAELSRRFPQSEAAARAGENRATLSCPE